MTKKVANIIIEDFVNCTVAGITPEHTQFLIDEYAVYTDNYFFSPDFQMDRWDGKFNFFTAGNRTYGNFIIEVADSLKKLGYKIKVTNKRPDYEVDIPLVDENYFADHGWTLGEHQVKAINSVLETHDGIIRVGTGGGKTLITAVLADSFLKKNLRTIIIVPTKDLIVQTAEEIEQFGIDVGRYYAKEKSLDKPVVVSTWQSLAKNKKLIATFDAVMVDECHGSKANTLFNILSNQGKDISIRIGLTGTLPEGDCSLMKTFAVLGPVRATVKASYLIEKGWLADLKLLMVKYKEEFEEEWEYYKKHVAENEKEKNISYTEFKNTKLFPEYQNEKSFLQKNNDRIENMASLIRNVIAEYGNTFVLVNTIKFGNKLAEEIGGENTFFINSAIKDRNSVYAEFDNHNDLCGIATFKLASTGLNIPRIFTLVLVDGGKSAITIVQSIGRSLRRADDKEIANVLDIHSNTKFSMRHARRRKKIYKDEKYGYSEITMNYDDEPEKAVQKCLKKLKSLNSGKSKKDLEEDVLEK